MSATILYGEKATLVEDARVDGDGLWLGLDELRRAARRADGVYE